MRTALGVRERVTALANDWRAQGWELGIGAGIAQGYATTLGAIGFEGCWDSPARAGRRRGQTGTRHDVVA